MVHIKNAIYTYPNGTKALSGMNLDIEKGEFVFVVGSSGAGKSTFIKLLTKELTPTSGEVLVAGQDLTTLKNRDIPYFRRRIGIVFQDFRLIPTLNVYDNVAFVLRVTNRSNRYIKSRVNYVLDLVKLTDKKYKRPDELSGGEVQRVAIARALAADPPLIIADEPTGNVDPELSMQIITLLKEINSYYNTTILVVTHDHDMVRHFGGRTIDIERGIITYDQKIKGKYERQ